MGRRLLCIALLCCSSVAAAAQTTTLRTTVPLVVVPTSVTDAGGHPIETLTPDDFVVLDERQPRPVHVDVVDDGLPPVAMLVAVQTSDISGAALAKISRMGATVSQAVVGGNGEAAVVTFDSKVKVVQDFTSDPDDLGRAFQTLKQSHSKRGRMLDAVVEGTRMLQDRPGPRRRAMLILGETRDRGSEAPLSDALIRTQLAAVTVYTVNYSTFVTPFTTKAADYTPPDGGCPPNLILAVVCLAPEIARLAKTNTAAALTAATGGTRSYFAVKSKLADDLLAVGKDVHTRYLLSFTPPSEARPGFHHLRITVRNHPEAAIRARPGYWTGFSVSPELQ